MMEIDFSDVKKQLLITGVLTGVIGVLAFGTFMIFNSNSTQSMLINAQETAGKTTGQIHGAIDSIKNGAI